MQYRINSNNGTEQVSGDLADFLSEFPYLFLANALPPFVVVRDFCTSDPASWGGGGRVEWDFFDVAIHDYKKAMEVLSTKFGYQYFDVPDRIDTAHKWYLWQYTVRYGVPFDDFFQLSEDEIYWDHKLEEAKKTGDEAAILNSHIMKVEASDALEDFLQPFLSKNK